MKINFKKNLRLIIGIATLVLGGVFMFIPFIPLGYILLFVGAFLLANKVPFLRRFMKWLKRKDKSGKLEKAEDKVNEAFESDGNKEKKEENPVQKKFNIHRVD